MGTGLKRSGDVTLDVPPPHEDELEEPEIVRGVESPTLKTVMVETDDPILDPSVARETVMEVETVTEEKAVKTVTEEAAAGPATETATAAAPMEPEVPIPVKKWVIGTHPGPYHFNEDSKSNEEDPHLGGTTTVPAARVPAARPEDRPAPA